MGCQKRGTRPVLDFLPWQKGQTILSFLKTHKDASTPTAGSLSTEPLVGPGVRQMDQEPLTGNSRAFGRLHRPAIELGSWRRQPDHVISRGTQGAMAVWVYGPPTEGVPRVLLQTLPTLGTFLGLLPCQNDGAQAEAGWGLRTL